MLMKKFTIIVSKKILGISTKKRKKRNFDSASNEKKPYN